MNDLQTTVDATDRRKSLWPKLVIGAGLVIAGVLFLYAAAERLGLIEGVTAWGLTGILMGGYLLASFIMSARRGLS